VGTVMPFAVDVPASLRDLRLAVRLREGQSESRALPSGGETARGRLTQEVRSPSVALLRPCGWSTLTAVGTPTPSAMSLPPPPARIGT
jgi:hypothetical protein